jgi:HAD superfamily hydrolase (TIGR01509 family)
VSRPFAAVIFDMDGVLVDSEPIHVEAARVVLAPYGIEFGDVDNGRFLGCTDPEMFGILAAEHGLALDPLELTRRRGDLVIRMLRERCVPMDGAREVLARLVEAGLRLALASSSAPDVIAATLEALGVAPRFEVVVSGLDVARSKPAPDIFVEAARRLGVAPARCLVVEDSRNGLLAAKAAGMACASIPCPASSHQDFSEADFRPARLADLLAIVAA